jgi:hypothetical protein
LWQEQAPIAQVSDTMLSAVNVQILSNVNWRAEDLKGTVIWSAVLTPRICDDRYGWTPTGPAVLAARRSAISTQLRFLLVT